MRRRELEFANDPRGAIESTGSGMAWISVLSIAALIAVAIVWASIARVEQVTTGEGQVIPTSQVQIVESLDPGIVSRIMVKEGESVEQGQPLLEIDATGAASRLGELHEQQVALKAELARLRAEVQGADQMEALQDTDDSARAAYADQIAAFKVNRRRLAEQRAVRNQQLAQKRQSLAEAKANADKQEASLGFLKRELELTERLFKRKAVPEIEVLRLRRGTGELEADIRISAATKLRLEAELAEMQALLTSDETVYLSEVQARLAIVNTELSVVDQSIRGASERVTRAILRAPTAGIVNQFTVVGVGEVVKAGVTVAEIVPLGDKLKIEARIRPQDIGFIAPGLDAVIRLSAYDYTKYGSLKGKVERIGVDTITDDNRETFYQVIISTNDDPATAYGNGLKIIPGMVASVDIAIGERTILNYLLKPVLRVANRALRDPS